MNEGFRREWEVVKYDGIGYMGGEYSTFRIQDKDNKEELIELDNIVDANVLCDYLNELEEKKSYNVKLDFIVNLLFDILCHVDVHYEAELLGYKLGEAEQLGFNITPSKSWDYEVTDYEIARKSEEFIKEYKR